MVLYRITLGLPFPHIDEDSPDAGVKVAYNWRYGPFLPPKLSLDGEQKIVAYSIDPARPEALVRDDSDRDYRNENNCERVVLMRSDQLRERSKSLAEWKERGDDCGPDRAASITIRYSDPTRSDDDYSFIPALRKWREISLQGGYPNQSCTYACTQLFWEYLPPKTEVYSITLAGKQPILACLGEGAAPTGGILEGDDTGRFGSLDCRVRQAYVVEMKPRNNTPERILHARAYIDSETFVYLAGEFFRDAQPDADTAVWRLESTEGGQDLLLLANDYYVPADRPNFLLALDLDSTKLLDASSVSKQMFNPHAQMFSDGRM